MTKIFAVLNLTTDSFASDGFDEKEEELSIHLESLVKNGVEYIDIGAESTRPTKTGEALPIELAQKLEKERLDKYLSKILEITKKNNIITSIDTRFKETALKALEIGVDILNDVSGEVAFSIIDYLKEYKEKKIILMYNRGLPTNPDNTIPPALDPVEEVRTWLLERASKLEIMGIERKRIIIDPGIGFGQTPHQALQILKHADKFTNLGYEIMIGCSRKSFMKTFTSLDAKDRDIETYAVTAYLADKNIDYLRVHNFIDNARILKVMEYLNA